MQREPKQTKSPPVGWPFWTPVLLTTIPFTLLFRFFVNSTPHDPIPWWDWIFAIPIGLLPALLLGLIVQTLWSVGVAVKQKRFTPFDGLFALLMLALSAIPGWLYWRIGERFDCTIITTFIYLVIWPLVGIYARKRGKQANDAA
jgi:hypothetical protein